MNPRTKSWRTTTILSLMALVVIVSISQQPALAAGPWYVAPTGNNSNSCLSTSSPCATIAGALSKVSSGDTIYVAVGTYTNSVGSEVVLIDKGVTLSGGWDEAYTTQGGISIIDGQQTRRGIAVSGAITVTIERFTIQNGIGGGGGILNTDGYLTVASSNIISNSALYPNGDWHEGGGIFNAGTLVLTNSTLSGNTGDFGGGGIFNNSSGIATIINSNISGNIGGKAGFSGGPAGGGIKNRGVMTLSNSTVSHNKVLGTFFGGGLANEQVMTITNSTISHNTIPDSAGGGIEQYSGTLAVNNSTISSNTAAYGGGVHTSGGVAYLNNSTVSNNNATIVGISFYGGGGLYNGQFGTMTLRNTIVARNLGEKPNCYGVNAITSDGYNLIGDTSGCAFTSSTGDLLNVDPKLFVLSGSPAIHLLFSSSPAINAGNVTGCADQLGNPLSTDQRGMPRIGRCDIGAYEFDPSNNPIRQVFLPLVRTTCKPGICGRVTLAGTPVASVSLELRFFNGTSWYTLATTNTDADGNYSFASVPSLTPGQRYYVRYRNYLGMPGRLWVWGTRELTSYLANSNFEIGNFDIADIPLIAPANDAMIALPYAFQWTRRTATPSDTYELDLYDPTDGNPYFFTAPLLGYVGTYTLSGLPSGFSPGAQYVWEIWVYSPDGGFGISYETRTIKFSNTGMSVTTTIQLTQPETKLDLEDRRKK